MFSLFKRFTNRAAMELKHGALSRTRFRGVYKLAEWALARWPMKGA